MSSYEFACVYRLAFTHGRIEYGRIEYALFFRMKIRLDYQVIMLALLRWEVVRRKLSKRFMAL